MKKILDFKVIKVDRPTEGFALLELMPVDGQPLPDMLPGQFVQVRVDNSSSTFLRRPISICDCDKRNNTLSLLIRAAGDGTKKLVELTEGSVINILLPLGNGFTVPEIGSGVRPLLIGGGVGTAPLLMLAKAFKDKGIEPVILIGARTSNLVLLREQFKKIGKLYVTTDDGSEGECGVAVNHSIMASAQGYNKIFCCGPAPMMKSVAAKAKVLGIDCEVSLENMMACGLGACLCCVENTVKGNVCVCTEGPVFNINQLTW